MDRAPTLALRTDADPALDMRALFAEGLDHLRKLAGATWTDHNLHDPGITVLEILTYALAELAMRADLPLADLVALPSADATAAQFWRARQVLLAEPLTAHDYRRLLIDLPGVKNAWVLPHALTLFADIRRRELRSTDPHTPGVRAVALHGLFDVKLDFMDEVQTQARKREVIAAVHATLARHRNLCQEFVDVAEVVATDVAVCAEVELERDADAHSTGAAIAFAWQESLAPAVPNRSLAEMLARSRADGTPLSAAEVFDGPALVHGFIASEDLAASELASEIRLSDLIAATIRVPGVGAVRDLTANALDGDGNGLPRTEAWRAPLPPATRARLAARAGRLVLYKREMPVLAWSFDTPPERVETALAALRDAARRKVETPREEELPLPPGRARELAAYHSVQHHFPAIYGIGDAVLPSHAGPAREVQALQLGAYLLLFDQWLGNAQAQLAHAQRTLSLDPLHLRELSRRFADEPLADRSAEPRHQVAQRISSLPRHTALYEAGLTDALLGARLESRAEAATRWQASLDHLLARAGEDFAAYVAVMRSAFGASDAQVIADRCRFLEEAPALARERGLAHDASAEPATLWNSANVSGLQRRIARLLGINDVARRNLALVSYDTYAEIDATPGDEFRFRVRHALDNKILLSSSTHYVTPEAARAVMVAAIERAQQPAGYQRRVTTDGKPYFNIVDAAGEVIARRIEYFADAPTMEDAISGTASYLRDHYSGEGLYLIEGLALRLVDAADRALICTDPDCIDCSDDDPFSYRVHFVLPAFAGRFQEAGFRQFAEQTIRQETPAHLLPKVCWVGSDDMAAVETAYREWITLPASASTEQRRTATAALREVLARAKNIHPARRLFDCTSDEEKPYFVLGRSALGSITAPPPIDIDSDPDT